ncbi:MAG: hypothetical protein HY906_05040 [Deltaproteobacteria bacterium]|nr:hypothetical protein [Deltaproteobacteria bacterium]
MTRAVRALPPLLTLAAILAATPARAAGTLQSNGTGQKAGFFQVSAADATHAMAVGTHDDGQGNQAAVVAVTTDGLSWQQTKPVAGALAFYLAVHMVTPQKAFLGMTGKLLVTQDGGGTWTPYTEADWGPLKGPAISGIGFAGGFFESLAGYAADGPGPNCGSGTPDGGHQGGDGGGGDDGGGGGCGCRAAGTGGAVALAVLAIGLVGGLCSRGRRRRW